MLAVVTRMTFPHLPLSAPELGQPEQPAHHTGNLAGTSLRKSDAEDGKAPIRPNLQPEVQPVKGNEDAPALLPEELRDLRVVDFSGGAQSLHRHDGPSVPPP